MSKLPKHMLDLKTASAAAKGAQVDLERAILEARRQGATLVEISEVLGIRHQSLSEYLRRREQG